MLRAGSPRESLRAVAGGQRRDLGGEGRFLAVVQQRERVRARTSGRHVVPGSSGAAQTIRAAADATAESWLSMDSTRVSSSTTSAKLPRTVRIGDPGK